MLSIYYLKKLLLRQIYFCLPQNATIPTEKISWRSHDEHINNIKARGNIYLNYKDRSPWDGLALFFSELLKKI